MKKLIVLALSLMSFTGEASLFKWGFIVVGGNEWTYKERKHVSGDITAHNKNWSCKATPKASFLENNQIIEEARVECVFKPNKDITVSGDAYCKQYLNGKTYMNGKEYWAFTFRSSFIYKGESQSILLDCAK